MPAPDADLLGQSCPKYFIEFTAANGMGGMYVAPKSVSFEQIRGWQGAIVVFRAHTHDGEAPRCAADDQAACQAALVVESVVWPTVPGNINGEHVYRSADLIDTQGQKPQNGFLLGGFVRMVPPQPIAAACATSDAARRLSSACTSIATLLDGWEIAPSGVPLTNGRVEVVRAHFDETLASQCPADLKATCEQSVLVDSVVWSANPYSTTGATPTAYP